MVISACCRRWPSWTVLWSAPRRCGASRNRRVSCSQSAAVRVHILSTHRPLSEEARHGEHHNEPAGGGPYASRRLQTSPCRQRSGSWTPSFGWQCVRRVSCACTLRGSRTRRSVALAPSPFSITPWPRRQCCTLQQGVKSLPHRTDETRSTNHATLPHSRRFPRASPAPALFVRRRHGGGTAAGGRGRLARSPM